VSYDGETERTIPLGKHRRKWEDSASIGNKADTAAEAQRAEFST
jgi:hypothetical protein